MDRDIELSGTFACGGQQVLYGVRGVHKLVRSPLLQRKLKEFFKCYVARTLQNVHLCVLDPPKVVLFLGGFDMCVATFEESLDNIGPTALV